MKGVEGVIHVASPFVYKMDDPKKDLLDVLSHAHSFHRCG